MKLYIKKIKYVAYGDVGESEIKSNQGTIYMYVPSSKLHLAWINEIKDVPSEAKSIEYRERLVNYMIANSPYKNKSWFTDENQIAIYGNPNYENPFLGTAVILETLRLQSLPKTEEDTKQEPVGELELVGDTNNIEQKIVMEPEENDKVK